jgi:hypothetical protein
VHRACIGIAELTHLEVDDNQTAQAAVEEEKIDTKPSVIQSKPLLPSEKSKVVAQLQQKIGEVVDECSSRSDSEYSSFSPRNSSTNGSLTASSAVMASPASARTFQHGGFILRERDALVKLASDLTVKLTNRPAGA